MRITIAMVTLALIITTIFVALNNNNHDSNIIVMGTEATFKPFQYREPNGDIVGFDIAISEKIAEELGATLIIEDVGFAALIPMLQTGRVDFIAAGLTVTEERSKNVDFSIPYFTSKQVVLVNKNNYEANTIKEIDDLNGLRIGAQFGSGGEKLALYTVKDADVTSFNSIFNAVSDLNIGRIDAIIVDEQPAKRIADAHSNIKIIDVGLPYEEYAIAVAKGNTELLEVINYVIEDMKESGEYDRLIQIYF